MLPVMAQLTGVLQVPSGTPARPSARFIVGWRTVTRHPDPDDALAVPKSPSSLPLPLCQHFLLPPSDQYTFCFSFFLCLSWFISLCTRTIQFWSPAFLTAFYCFLLFHVFRLVRPNHRRPLPPTPNRQVALPGRRSVAQRRPKPLRINLLAFLLAQFLPSSRRSQQQLSLLFPRIANGSLRDTVHLIIRWPLHETRGTKTRYLPNGDSPATIKPTRQIWQE